MLLHRTHALIVFLSIGLAACADQDDGAPSSAKPARESTRSSDAGVDDAVETDVAEDADVALHTDVTVEARIAVVRRRIAANNTQDWETWEALHTEDAVRTAPELAEPLRGRAAMRAGIEELLVTFPDYTLTLVDAFGSGDQLMARIHTRATMLGPMDIGAGPIEPTGQVFEQDWVALLRFDGDRIAAIDEFHDNYGILVQLGLLGAQ